ncbi:hypothetical protein Tco_0435562 [Tanacetum coccineum]
MKYKELQSRAKQPASDLDDDVIHVSRKKEAKFMQTFHHNLWDIIINGDLQEEHAPTGDQSGPSAPPMLNLSGRQSNQGLEEMKNPKDCKEWFMTDEMKRSSSSTSNSQNLAFLSFENTSRTNEVSTASGNFGVNNAGGTNSSSQVFILLGADEVVCSFFAQQTTSPPLDNEEFQQIVR